MHYLSLPQVICIEYLLRFCADCFLFFIAFSLYSSELRDVLLFIYLFLCLSHIWPFCNPMDCSPPGFSGHGISQARLLQWVSISFSRGSSWLKDQTCISCIGRQILYHWDIRELHPFIVDFHNKFTSCWCKVQCECDFHAVLQGPRIPLSCSSTPLFPQRHFFS